MKYAVIALSGTQYQVKENQIITVNNLDMEEGKTSSLNDVLLLVNDADVKVGTPNVDGASVEYKIVKNYKGEKIRVSKYKAKSRYRLTNGFRSTLTDIQITKITF